MNQYKKILGLRYLEKNGFSVPPYAVIDLNKEKFSNFEKYISETIEKIVIPLIENDRVGVTIRVSLPGKIDKKGKHGGLHFSDMNKIIEKVLNLHESYKPKEKIIIQHTVDARCSGTILSEDQKLILEIIPGDAPLLLEGKTSNYESWQFTYKWNRVKSYQINQKSITILNEDELNNFIKYLSKIEDNSYLEWSISKNGKLYFYEYQKFNH